MVPIKIYFRESMKSTNEGFVWISFYLNSKKVNFSTKIRCFEKDFDKKHFRIKNNVSNVYDKNLIIERILARINNVFVKYRLRNKKLTRDAFLRAYNRPDDYPTFYDYVKDFQKKNSSLTEPETIRVHDSVINKLKVFSPDLHFDDITSEWLDKYYAYLRKTLKNNDNTAYKNMATFRKYARAAWKAGYMDEYVFENWHIKRVKSNYTYLTEDELNGLIKLYKEGELEAKYHKALEFFLFMCFSSLHIGDAKKLKLEQFTDDSFTYFRIKNRNSKPEPIIVPVSSTLRQLIGNF